MTTLAIIPARYASTRFPGKPLADIMGKPMIQHVYQRVADILPVVVATDDERIYNVVKNFGGSVVMTKNKHESGTDRCAEALQIFEKQKDTKFDVVINVQGDEPFIHKQQIKQLVNLFENKQTKIATLVKPISNKQDLLNTNKVKVVLNNNKQAMYFSRLPIPYLRSVDEKDMINKHIFFQHVGMYGYQKDTLLNITKLPKSSLENAEMLEQLRWLQNGYTIDTDETNIESKGIDTPEDLIQIINSKKFN